MSTVPTKALLLGATSLLGFTLARRFPGVLAPLANPHNRAADGEDWHRARLDRPEEWVSILEAEPPALVLYAHAVCDVAKCERHPDWAYRLNVDCLALVLSHLPAACRLVYLSSDHVFGNDGAYNEASAPCPISAYGRTRVAAEDLVLKRPGSLVVRFGLPIGTSLNGRTGFHDWLRYRAHKQLPVTVIADEARSAVWVEDLADRVYALATSDHCGIRHIPAMGSVERPALARFLLHRQGLPPVFEIQKRAQQPYPHLGRIEIVSRFTDAHAIALPSVMPASFDGSSYGNCATGIPST